MILCILVSVVLLAIAVIHALWGRDIWWPIRAEEKLAHAVVGARGVTRMPGPIPCFLVAAALVILTVMLWVPAGLFSGIVIWGAGVVFLLRGALAYTKIWRKMTPEEPFATFDRRYYGPLCLCLGVAFIIINLGR